jgi:hypothetical protein
MPFVERFCFGSNLDGNHGAGAALYALRHCGAVMGVGEGPTGDAYALPTVGKGLSRMSFTEVKKHVHKFLLFAAQSPYEVQKVTRVGCLRAGFTDAQMAPLFAEAPFNCRFDTEWRPYLPATARFWGTF